MYEQNNASSFANDYSSFTSIQRVSDCHHALPTPTDMADVGSAIFVVCSAIAITLAIRSILRAQEFKRERAAFKRLPILARAAFVSIMVAVIAYGGSKPGTNYLEKVTRPLAVLLNSGEQRESTPDAILLTENQQLAGFALTAVVTNETFDLSAPLNATVHSNWLKRGAAEDGFWVMSSDTFRLGTNHYDAVYVSSSGTLSFDHPKSSPVVRLMPDDSSIAFLAPLQTVLGIPPESRWNLLTATNSLFWHDITDSGSARFTWQNVLLQRDAALPLSFQAELFPSGDFIFRYDFSSLAPNLLSLAPDFVIGAQNNGGGETALIATEDWHCTETNHLCASLYSLDGTNLITTTLCSVITNSPKFSLRWKNIGNLDLSADDPDGDGISTWDEVFIYHTDPENADTDGDGLSDAVEIASGTGTNGTSPLDPDTDGDGVPDGLTESEWLSHSLFGGTNAPNLMLSVATSFDDPPAAALNVAGLALPVRNGATWALRLEPGVSYAFRLANATDRAIRFEACDPGDAAGLTLTKTLEIQSRAQGTSAPAAAFVIDDPDGLFDRGAISGEGNFGFAQIKVEPDAVQVGSMCLHDTEAAEFDVSVAPDFAADRIVWTVTGGSVSFSPRRGTVFLSLDSGESYATATATISPTNSLFGSVSMEMSVHRHESAGAYCTACGYAHTDEPGCGHDSDCAALLSLENDCTCAPRFIQVNSDDDDLNGTEDRNQTILAEGENDPISLKLPTQEPCAYCSCGEGLAYFKVTGHSSGLRLRRNGDIIGNGAEVTSFNSFSIEATQPSPLIGSHQITYDIYSESDSKSCRRITRHFTSANAQIKPDYDDSGSVDRGDALTEAEYIRGGVWLLARRQEPYLIHLQNECPDDAVLSLSLSGSTNWPALKASPTGPALLTPLSGSVTKPPLAIKNGTTSVWLDASCTTTVTTLSYTIAPSNGVPFVSDSQAIQIVDTSLPELWIAQGGTATYSFADVTAEIDWWLYDEDGNFLDSGYGASFEVGSGLASGDYDVWAYFPSLLGDNFSYTPLHIVRVDIEQEEENALAGTESRAHFSLNETSSPMSAEWKIEPIVASGARLFVSDSGGMGAEILSGSVEVFVSPGSIATNYTVTTWNANCTNAFDVAIFKVVKITQIDIVPSLCEEGLNQPPFTAMTEHVFNVTHSPFPDKHAVVFYRDSVDTGFVFRDVLVNLNAEILPDPDNEKGLGGWTKVDGPDSGTLSGQEYESATFQNPQKGGIYKFAYNFDLPDNVQSEGILVLPLAGAGVDAVVAADLLRTDVFASNVMARYSPRQRNNNRNGLRWFFKNGAGDYRGRPDVLQVANDPYQTVWCYNQVNDESGLGSVATWAGIPVRMAKISNFTVGYAAAKIGVSSWRQSLSQLLGEENDLSASASWDAGVAVAGGTDYGTTVSNLVRNIWNKADEKNQKLWPNPMPAENHVAPEAVFNFNYVFCSPGFLYMTNP